MPNFDAWCIGKPYLIQWLGLLIAYAASDIQTGLNSVRNGRMYQTFSQPDTPEQWLELYKSDTLTTITKSISNMLNGHLIATESYAKVSITKSATDKKQLVHEFIELINASTIIPGPMIPKQIQTQLDEIDQTIRKVITDIAQSSSNDHTMLKDTTLAFLATVWLPCFLVHGKSPDHLFVQASTGDFTVINQLARYDPWIIYAPNIQKHIMAARSTRPADYKRIMKSATLNPYRKHNAWALKSDLGGFLLATAKVIGYRLTNTEVIRLFDAYAFDHHGLQEDADIPREDQEAYRKQLYRRRNYWIKAMASMTNHWQQSTKTIYNTTGTKQNQEMSEK